jgi:hypothetical protein
MPPIEKPRGREPGDARSDDCDPCHDQGTTARRVRITAPPRATVRCAVNSDARGRPMIQTPPRDVQSLCHETASAPRRASLRARPAIRAALRA